MRAYVACVLAGLVPAQAFMHGGLVPLRASVGSAQAFATSPMVARSSSLPLPSRRAAAVSMMMSAESAAVGSAVSAAKPNSVFKTMGKVFVSMMTIFLLLGTPMDADAARRSGGRMGGGFNKAQPRTTLTQKAPASTAATSTSTAATAAPAAATSTVHHHHHGGGGGGGFFGGMGRGMGMGMGMGMMGMGMGGFSPFGGYGMMGFRPMVPFSAIFLFAGVAAIWVFMSMGNNGRRR